MSIKDCTYPWEWMLVSANGAAHPCCFSRTVDFFDERSAEEIWNGARFQKLRLAIARDEVHPACRDAPCKFVQHSSHSRPFFDEEFYLARYPDVKTAVRSGQFRSARDHFDKCGAAENRAPNDGGFPDSQHDVASTER